jgi:hypothetical protein
MGRYGNVMLTGGETEFSAEAQAGEVVRFYFTNTANTRLFNVAIPGARLKLVGGDKTHAVLRAETYDRAQKAWVGKTALTAPGEMVAGTGWSLKGLRFDEFTLVADVTDDDGVARVLTTRD